MHPRIARYLHDNGIASVMNATKWRELAARCGAIAQGELAVRVRFLLDDAPSGFACFDWAWLGERDAGGIEWLEIDPVHRTFRGRLVADAVEDFGAAVEAALREVGVPFSREGGVFRVWGHVRPGARPEFA